MDLICLPLLFDFLIAKFRTVIVVQHFWNVGKFQLELRNCSLRCFPVNLSHFEEIGQAICLLPNDNQISSKFLTRARRQLMLVKLFAGLCWRKCLPEGTLKNNVSNLGTPSRLI